jgi:predicted outer membrane repeat protein
VSDCIFSDNQAGSSTGSYDSGGGAIYSGAGTLKIQGGLFHKNQALGGGDIGKGGAIYLGSFSTQPSTIDGAVFVNNGASLNGGAVYSQGIVLHIANSYFAANGALAHGGAVWVEDAYPGTVDQDSRFLNLTMAGNRALKAGAINYINYIGSYGELVGADLQLSQSILAGNVAQDNGGALSISGASPTINHSAFVGNEVGLSGLGAAIYNDIGSNPVMHNSIVWKNTIDGGAANDGIDYSPEASNEYFTITHSAVELGYDGGGCSNPDKLSPSACDSQINEIWTYPCKTSEVIDGPLSTDVPSFTNETECRAGNLNEWNPSAELNTDNISLDNTSPFTAYPSTATAGGPWTAVPTFDPTTFQTTLTHDNAGWTPDEHIDRFIRPNIAEPLMFLIVGNDATTMWVDGDLTALGSCAMSNDPVPVLDEAECPSPQSNWTSYLILTSPPTENYAIYDLNLAAGSVCLDNGDNGQIAFSLEDLDADGVFDHPLTKDLAGAIRQVNSTSSGTVTIDIGPYEKQ